MKNKILACLMLLPMAFPAVQAELYLEASLEGGGDTLVETNLNDEINAGGGIKFAVGIQNPMGPGGNNSLRLAVGYLFDSINASNGDADFDALTFDAIYSVSSGPHAFGFGGSLHMSPEYDETIDGLGSLQVEFDDALGMVLQYGYQGIPGFELGVRYTMIDYEAGSAILDADSFGLFISNGF